MTRKTIDQLAESCKLAALCYAAKKVTGKEVSFDEGRYQTMDRIHASSFQDILHEIGHWLAASSEERLIPNLGFDVPGADERWANAREFQAICHHTEIVRILVEDGLETDEELEYVDCLEATAEFISQGESNLRLHRHLANPKAQDVARIYKAKLQEMIGPF